MAEEEVQEAASGAEAGRQACRSAGSYAATALTSHPVAATALTNGTAASHPASSHLVLTYLMDASQAPVLRRHRTSLSKRR